jgi:hypothetical protein
MAPAITLADSPSETRTRMTKLEIYGQLGLHLWVSLGT